MTSVGSSFSIFSRTSSGRPHSLWSVPPKSAAPAYRGTAPTVGTSKTTAGASRPWTTWPGLTIPLWLIARLLPPHPVASWFHRMRPAKLAGYCLVFGLGLVTVASVACLAFMFIRHDEQVYRLVWTLIVKLSGRIFGGDRGE
ncbi:hypothetical protein MTO96_008203 [Rhipicephalus appendiculatus]